MSFQTETRLQTVLTMCGYHTSAWAAAVADYLDHGPDGVGTPNESLTRYSDRCAQGTSGACRRA